MNIDAITAWRYGGLRIDNIPRSLWYTPQHTTSLALGLVGLLVASAAGARASLAAIAGAGLALGLATTINPLLGAVCSIIYGVADRAPTRSPSGTAGGFCRGMRVAAVPVVLAVALGGSQQGDGRRRLGAAVRVCGILAEPSRCSRCCSRSVRCSFRRFRVSGRPDRRTFAPGRSAPSGLVIALVMLYLVRISEASWVGFRAGQLILVSLPMLLAPVLARLNGSRRLGRSPH